ncbi:unnamed protein product [Polarella glacialis]|uniref:ATP synthase mitochondrial F1 complex assembly factor 1 n=2 Tax=Polarella glacialis TaxID=89957 RepID=A0A813EV70_POLGL|nr:unnamed protein product [Polarella glacialis]
MLRASRHLDRIGRAHVAAEMRASLSLSLGSLPQKRCAKTGHVGEGLAPGVPGGRTRLSDVAKVPLFMKETSVRVRELWLEKYRDNGQIVAGALADTDYYKLKANMEACPMFLLPVPKGEGYQNFVWQVQENRILFKTIDGFQQNSPILDLSVTLFTELVGSHQLVLLFGEMQSGVFSKDEAALAIRYLREVYTDPEQFRWVKRFNHEARDFDYGEFTREFRPLERWQALGRRTASF